MTSRRIWILIAVAALVGFAALTLLALEGGEVVILRTRNAQGQTQQTRVWIADYEGAAIIEAANPERPFFLDLAQNPLVELERNGRTQEMQATVLRQPLGHMLIRRLLRQRYGWADWWIGLLTDTSPSLAIRLEPVPPA